MLRHIVHRYVVVLAFCLQGFADGADSRSSHLSMGSAVQTSGANASKQQKPIEEMPSSYNITVLEDSEAEADAVEANKAAEAGIDVLQEAKKAAIARDTILDNSSEVKDAPTTGEPGPQVAPDTVWDDSSKVQGASTTRAFLKMTDGGKRSTRDTPPMRTQSETSPSAGWSPLSLFLICAIPFIAIMGFWYSGMCRDASADFHSLAADARTPKSLGRAATPSARRVSPFEPPQYSLA